MNSQHHPTEDDSGTADYVTFSPRSDHPAANHRFPNDETQPRVRFMCSFGGKILPRPHDNQLRYLGGDTRIVAVHRHTSFSSLLSKLSKLAGTPNFSVKYQLPDEDLDALITVTTDEDVENMMEEYDRSSQNAAAPVSNASRLRLFLFSNDAVSRSSSISSLLDGSAKREHWFLDAFNGRGGPGLERGRSDVSSIVSEVPDHLFGLDNSEEQPREPKLKIRLSSAETVLNSDPGSPAPVVSSRFCSTSSSLAPGVVKSFSDLPPLEAKPENPVPALEHKEAQVESSAEVTESLIAQQSGYGVNPGWHYVLNPPYPARALQQVPVYYVSGPFPPGNVPVQPVSIQAQFVSGQIPVGYNQPIPSMGQVYSGGVRPVTAVDPYEMPARVVPDGVNQPLYYGIANAYPGMVQPGGEELPVTGTEIKLDRVSQT